MKSNIDCYVWPKKKILISLTENKFFWSIELIGTGPFQLRENVSSSIKKQNLQEISTINIS